MSVQRPYVTCLVDGIGTPIAEAHTRHSVDAPVATATVTLPLPLPAHVTENAVIELYATVGSDAGRIFQGVIRGPLDRELSIDGTVATLRCDGWCYLLALPQFEDLVWDGPIAAREVLRGILQYRGFGDPGEPTFVVDDILDLAGDPVMLGGNTDVDEGRVRIEAGESFLSFAQRVCGLFGYRIYDTPDGTVRVSRVSGTPTGAAAATYTEGVDLFAVTRSVDLHPIITYWEVLGASGKAADGSDFAYRSIPASVPSNPDIPTPPGATYRKVQDDLLSSNALCDLARNVKEIDHSDRVVPVSWETWGRPTRRPGEVIAVSSAVVGASGTLWLLSLTHDWSRRGGLECRMTAWAGSGEPLPAGADVCVTTTLHTGPTHVGDEVVAWYAVDTPTGTTITIPFTPVEDFTSITLTGRAHGCNSQFIDGVNADLTVSRFQLWQDGEQIGEGALPVLDENYAQQLDYTNDANWSDVSVPIPGNLVGGVAAELRIIAGVNPALPAATRVDDFEVKNIVLSNCAQGQPDLPTAPTNPEVPPATCDYASADATVPSMGSVSLRAGPWIWPAGKAYLRISGNATGLLAYVRLGATDWRQQSAHQLFFHSAGGPRGVIVPGTQDPANPESQDSGTPLVGDGPFEVWCTLAPPSGPATDQTVILGVSARSTVSEEAGYSTPGFTLTDICWQFLTSGESP